MINLKTSYGMVMKLEDKGSFVKGRLVTSKKDKRSDEWVSSWWDVMFVGGCLEMAQRLDEKARIVIESATAEVREWSDKDGNKRQSPSVTVFEFSIKSDTKEKREGVASGGASQGSMNNLPF